MTLVNLHRHRREEPSTGYGYVLPDRTVGAAICISAPVAVATGLFMGYWFSADIFSAISFLFLGSFLKRVGISIAQLAFAAAGEGRGVVL
jgi:hypothetical protein